MLPLWIIDLTQHSDRQARFSELIGRIGGTVNRTSINEHLQASEGPSTGANRAQWYYTPFDNPFKGIDKHDMDNMPNALYGFQEELIREGQQFVQLLRHSNIDSATTLNVCVIADATEEMSQLLFPSVAAMLQKEKGRIVPNHIHQGISIVGILYIPSNANSLSVSVRQSILLTLKEIEVQHNVSAVRGYDRMFIYQDVQNRTENYYPILDGKGQAEYLVQCLVHLYYACDKVHPLISGSSSDEKFYFTLGVSSVFFDTEAQDKIDCRKVINGIIEQFEAQGDNETTDNEETSIDFDKFNVDQIIDEFSQIDFDLTKAKIEPSDPHPISGFLNKKLMRLYFHRYLKYYPANLRLKQLETISAQSEATLKDISASRKRMQRVFEEETMPATIIRLISASDKHKGCLPQITNNLKKLKLEFGAMKVKVKQQLEEDIWQQLIQNNVPKKYLDDFEAYHEAYASDLSDSRFSQREALKESAQNDFINILKKESTFASRISQAFLGGIATALTVTTSLIYLYTEIKPYSALIATILFLVPLIVQLVYMAVFQYQKEIKERRLTAYFLHDAYARITNRIQTETSFLYDNLMELCDEYVERAKRIKREVRPLGFGDIFSEVEIPASRFNQPIIGGEFSGKRLIPEEEDEYEEIYVNRVPVKIGTLDEEDYHLLIHHHKEIMSDLFRDVEIKERNTMKFDDTLGYNVFISKEEQEREREERWEETKNTFHKSIAQAVKKEILPRKYPTIGEKIRAHFNKRDNAKLLEPAIKTAATNGELTSSADQEIADIKVNLHLVKSLMEPFLPKSNTQYQFDEHKELFGKYLFITRWRTFDTIALNRILPSEDFDTQIRAERINQEELRTTSPDEPSSLILWATCKDDNSNEWLKLFDGTELSTAIQLREKYRTLLYKKD